MKKVLLITILTFLSSSVFAQVDFQKGSLADMYKMAKDQKKILMVDVMTDWCKWCIELDNKVYAKPDMYEFANAKQINYKIDAEKGEGVDFAKKYGIKGYPTVLFLNADGSEVDRIYGYVPLKDFVEMMKDYNKGVNTMSYLKKKLETNPDDIITNLKMADKLITMGENDAAKKNLQKIIDIDPQDLSGKVPEAKYDLATLSDKEHIVQNIQGFISDYPNSDKIKDAYITLAETYYYTLNDKENADKTFNQVLLLFTNDDMVKSSYGQYLNSLAGDLADKGSGESDYNRGLAYIDEALPYVKSSVNEASSYYLLAKLFFNLKEYPKASESIDKALKIFDRKLYRDLRDKIQKELSEK
jgi:thioredoxin-related protein